jgi:hypothetical protein
MGCRISYAQRYDIVVSIRLFAGLAYCIYYDFIYRVVSLAILTDTLNIFRLVGSVGAQMPTHSFLD